MTFEARTTQAAARKPFYKRWWFILLTVLIVLALVFFGVVLYEAKRIAGDIDASVDDCKEQVINRAKYPGSARIVDYDVEHSPVENSNHAVRVTGEADFPNGFGTPVRMTFECPNIIVFGSDGYKVLDVYVHEK